MEQIRNLDQLLEYAKEVGPKKISVACAEDTEVMEAVENARKAGIANAFLVATPIKSKKSPTNSAWTLPTMNHRRKGGEAASALKAVELVSSGQAQIVMKAWSPPPTSCAESSTKRRASQRQDALARLHPSGEGL